MPTNSDIYFKAIKKIGLKPKWETDYGLLSFSYQKKKNYIFLSKTSLNNQMNAALACNKHFTRILAGQAGLPNIAYCFPSTKKELEFFFNKHKVIIGKPTLGTLSKGVQLIKTKKALYKFDFSDRIYEKYINGIEYRCLVLMQKVIACQKKPLKSKKNKSWDLQYIGLEKKELNQNMIDMSLRAAKIVGLNWCSVDFIMDKSKTWLLEINSAPGIVHMHYPDAGKSFDIATKVIKAILGN